MRLHIASHRTQNGSVSSAEPKRRIRVHIAFAALRAVFVNDTFFFYIYCLFAVKVVFGRPHPRTFLRIHTHTADTTLKIQNYIFLSCHVFSSCLSELRYDAEWCACSAQTTVSPLFMSTRLSTAVPTDDVDNIMHFSLPSRKPVQRVPFLSSALFVQFNILCVFVCVSLVSSRIYSVWI